MYIKTRLAAARAAGDGLGVDIGTVASGIATAADITTDPYLPETICRARQLLAIEAETAVPTCVKTASGKMGGIGLRKAMPVLRGYVFAEQNPWVYPVAAAVAIGVPFLLGVLIGRSSK